MSTLIPSTQQGDAAFSQAMRDRQARGKDAYTDGDGDEQARTLRLGQGFASGPFEDREKRAFALSVLDSREQLMMYAQSENDSIPGQRFRFTAMLCGFDEKAARDGWKGPKRG